MKWSRSAIFLSLLGLAVCFGSSCASDKKGKDAAADEGVFRKLTSKPVPVTTYVVGSREVPLVINADGKTEPTDRFEAKSPAAVKIQKVFVEEGAKVQAGDALVKFDDEFSKLRLNVVKLEIRESDEAIAALNAQKGGRAANLEDEKGENEAQVLEAKTIFYQAQSERAKAEEELLGKMADMDQLNSPIAGIVTKRTAADGGDAAESQVLMEVVRLDPIYFSFKVPLSSVSGLDKGPEVSVSLTALPGQDLTGEISAVGTEADSQSGGGVDVKVKIPNPDLTYKADMRGTVQIRTQAKRKVLVIPDTALVKTEHSNYVYKIDNGKARKTAVDLGTLYNGQPTVEKGLAEGDTIISSSDEDLRDGATVEIAATKSSIQ